MRCARAWAEVRVLSNALADPSLVQPLAHASGRLSLATLHTLVVTLGDILASSLVVAIVYTSWFQPTLYTTVKRCQAGLALLTLKRRIVCSHLQ